MDLYIVNEVNFEERKVTLKNVSSDDLREMVVDESDLDKLNFLATSVASDEILIIQVSEGRLVI
ncbi:hypothetical protein M2139_001483 [Enterococcus sp. PF1-24]|uniref:hypothetical protein n=1 Tax=unclassified Enterococcus TaxID=2608891 RepID=UPI00247554F8|nr:MULTISPECIES: hypothetical protein [unclassified Enterococcus]MDH6364526.1 hypothetical protein [Enterococcus sp. PFB1-1]MDH6401597.1 hypothetical protein [Enterococcus sp. PF1-24]